MLKHLMFQWKGRGSPTCSLLISKSGCLRNVFSDQSPLTNLIWFQHGDVRLAEI